MFLVGHLKICMYVAFILKKDIINLKSLLKWNTLLKPIENGNQLKFSSSSTQIEKDW